MPQPSDDVHVSPKLFHPWIPRIFQPFHRHNKPRFHHRLIRTPHRPSPQRLRRRFQQIFQTITHLRRVSGEEKHQLPDTLITFRRKPTSTILPTTTCHPAAATAAARCRHRRRV
ncbi:hypothetical protein HanXRQr2_Chr06g0254881 [Helianthus annuus]|uniref:Uncharacterized protein n=1 Tax=Helianthus annuus TaxID=4232 RepID=A0A9K3NIZ0_HELAN|nr:hypothetical protein HanXRQr2_Chr06g0254881 [Helianthus annuus]KAJ0915097.1 hypothetical protein HanPSC8_Chr06g0246051 [Helianthus annuus]